MEDRMKAFSPDEEELSQPLSLQKERDRQPIPSLPDWGWQHMVITAMISFGVFLFLLLACLIFAILYVLY